MKSALLLLCSFLMVANAYAMGKKAPASPDPVASASPSPVPSPTQTIDLNPDNLRQYVLAGNDSIEDELFDVYTAKDNRQEAMEKLLPSLNLNAIIGSSTGSFFGLSTISFLLPFLVPDNWINLNEAAHQLTAEEYTYLILELNTYASEYALYETIINDYDALDTLNQNYQTLEVLYLTLALMHQTGTANETDVQNALEKAQQAEGQVIDMQRVIDVDVTTLRQAMGFGLDVALTFSKRIHVQPVPAETETATAVSAAALAVAPEAKQLEEVLAASDDSKWGAIFGFIGNYTLAPKGQGSSGGSGGSPDLSSVQGTSSVSIGFTEGTAVQLVQDNMDLVRAQLDDVSNTMDQEADSSLKDIAAFNSEVQVYAQAAQNSYEVYLAKSNDYKLGTDTLLDVLSAESDYFTSSGLKLQAQANLDQARISLNRMLLTEEFSPDKIKGCGQNIQPGTGDSGPFGWIKNIFDPGADRVTLDQMCQTQVPVPAPSSAPSPAPSAAR